MEEDSQSPMFGTRPMSVVLGAVLPLTVIAADTGSSDPAHAAARQLIQAFARASDRGDAEALQSLLHPAFRVVFNMQAGASPTVLDRIQYLKMVADGKIGGADRKVTVSAVSAIDGFASASARMERPDAVFKGTYSLIQQDDKWWLLEEAVLMSVVQAGK